MPTPPRFAPPSLASPPSGGGTTPFQGRYGCGLLLGRVPRVPFGLPAVGTATAGVGAPRSRRTSGGNHCPVYRWAMSRCRRCGLGAGGADCGLMGLLRYFRTLHLLTAGIPTGRVSGGHAPFLLFCVFAVYWCLVMSRALCSLSLLLLLLLALLCLLLFCAHLCFYLCDCRCEWCGECVCAVFCYRD